MIEVTLEDIVSGVERHCSLCPVARALRRTFKVRALDVGGGAFFLGGNSEAIKIMLPKAVSLWIERFDSKQKVQPMKFELSPTVVAKIEDYRLRELKLYDNQEGRPEDYHTA